MLPVQEIFYTIQGESRTAGIPTVFVRLWGCNLRCVYCDSGYYSHESIMKLPRENMRLNDIVEKVLEFGCSNVCITGGEPLIHKNIYELVHLLVIHGLRVEIETNGSVKVQDPRIASCRYILDIKTPSSGESDHNIMENLSILMDKDDVVFVIGSEEDYEFAKNVIHDYFKGVYLGTQPSLASSPLFFLSPVMPHGFVNEETSADMRTKVPEWLMRDKLPNTRVQIQMHKFLGLP